MLNREKSGCSEVLPSCSDTVMCYTAVYMGDLAPCMLESMSTHIVVYNLEIKFTLSRLVCWHNTVLYCGKITATSLRKTLFLCLNF